jgi:hypothetical protein
MKIFGLIGFPLEHSFSGKYFTEKFKKENIQNFRDEIRSKIEQLVKEVRDKSQQLKGSFLDSELTEEEILDLQNEVNEIRNQIAILKTEQKLKLKDVLTEEQLEKALNVKERINNRVKSNAHNWNQNDIKNKWNNLNRQQNIPPGYYMRKDVRGFVPNQKMMRPPVSRRGW